MASMDWQKLKTSSQVKAVIRHNDKSKRIEGNHSNKDIDTRQTHLNDQSVSFEEACKIYNERIYELDQRPGANIRKDRVTACMLCTSIPENLPEVKENEWIRKMTKIVTEIVGRDNLVGTWTHRDEKHEYIDKITNTMVKSRTHIHIMVIPEINGKLDAKHMCSRANFIKMNKAINDMTQTEYGIDYMNGRGSTKMDIETLKQLSIEKQREKEHQEALQALQKEKALCENERERYRQATQMYLDKIKELDEEQYEKEKAELKKEPLYEKVVTTTIRHRIDYNELKRSIINKKDDDYEL